MAKLNKAPYLFLFLSVISFKSLSAHGFFIDLETLGFSSSKDDGNEETSSSVLVAAPSEMQTTTVEVESKTDPNKSVRLTLEELKSLIMGSVKDMTAKANKPQPININISTKSRIRDKIPETTTQASSYSNTKYKYQASEGYPAPNEASEIDEDSWAYTPSISYEVNDVIKPTNSNEDDSVGILSAAKAVFRGPAHIMSSYSKKFNRWRSSPKSQPKPKFRPGRRPLPDIVVQDRRIRRRKKPQWRRPQRYGPPRRKRPLRVYYEEEYAEPEYYETKSRYGEAWDRMDVLPGSSNSGSQDFDSTLPGDDIPMNMSPPRPYVL